MENGAVLVAQHECGCIGGYAFVWDEEFIKDFLNDGLLVKMVSADAFTVIEKNRTLKKNCPHVATPAPAAPVAPERVDAGVAR